MGRHDALERDPVAAHIGVLLFVLEIDLRAEFDDQQQARPGLQDRIRAERVGAPDAQQQADQHDAIEDARREADDLRRDIGRRPAPTRHTQRVSLKRAARRRGG